MAWFVISFVVGVVFVIDLSVKERYHDLVFVAPWTVAAGAFALSEWRGLS